MTDHFYNQLPEAGQRLARIPRFGRLIGGISYAQLKKLNSNASVFWFLLSTVSASQDELTGLIDSGLRTEGARRLGMREGDNFDRTDLVRQWQVDLALYMLAAIAFEMTCGETGDGRSGPADRIQNAQLRGFMNRVFQRIFASTGYVDMIGRPLPKNPLHLNADWECLKHMNSVGLEYNVFSGMEREILFTDISLRNFLAAYWAVRWAMPKDHHKTTHWIPNPMAKKRNPEYYEFWDLAVDLHEVELDETDDQSRQPINRKCWHELFAAVLDCQRQPNPELPIRSTELIYRTWDRMEGTDARIAFQSEFKGLVFSDDEVAKSIVQELESSECQFVQLADPADPRDDCDVGQFQMGAPRGQDTHWDERDGDQDNPLHQVELSPFLLNRYCVTNEQFELFAPEHALLREFRYDETVDPPELRDVARHPVVNVTWYDGWCFAKWIDEIKYKDSTHVVQLPTEAQWEYACRCGQTTLYTWSGGADGNTIDMSLANHMEHIGLTVPVHGRNIETNSLIPKNPWGFHQLHGNVWELCFDRYGQDYYKASEGVAFNPVGPNKGNSRVIRGGGWLDFGMPLRSACRCSVLPSSTYASIGFRLAAVPVAHPSVQKEAEQ